MKQLALFCLCIVGTNSFLFYPGLLGNGRVVSRREDGEVTKQAEEPQVTTQDVYRAVGDLIVSARQGINASDLGEVASSIEGLTERFSSNEVTGEDVRSLLKEITAERGIDTSSNIFDDPISESENNLDSLFRLLQGLEKRGKSLEESDKANKIIIAAVRVVARSIQKTVINFVGFVSFVEANTKEGKTQNARSSDIAKRDEKRQSWPTALPPYDKYIYGDLPITMKPSGIASLDAVLKKTPASSPVKNKWILDSKIEYNDGFGINVGVTKNIKNLSVNGNLGYSPNGVNGGLGLKYTPKWGK